MQTAADVVSGDGKSLLATATLKDRDVIVIKGRHAKTKDTTKVVDHLVP